MVTAGGANAAAGDLDPSFGSGGVVMTNFGSSGGSANGLAAQADGKLVAAGFNADLSGNLDYDFALARYNTDGSLDLGFGLGGEVLTNFTGSGSSSSSDRANAVAIQPDGKIVAAGDSDTNNNFGFSFALARYNRDGTLDSTFGSGGKVLTPFSEVGVSQAVANAVVVQPDGKIVAAGYTNAGGSYDFALARYNADGSLDETFGSGGKVMTDFSGAGSFAQATAIAIGEDGSLTVAGSSTANDNNEDFALARYNADGSLVTSFGSGGKVLTDFSGTGSHDEAHSLAVGRDGKLVVCGVSDAANNYYDFALARYTGNGTLDTSFGTAGKVLTDFSGDGSVESAYAVAIQSDGKIVAAGLSFAAGGGNLALARYRPEGVLDTSFGSGGTVLGPSGLAKAVSVLPGGKIVAAGGANRNFLLARYLGR
jgi:uncharacterized delta-60 repeat protein